MKKLKLSVMAVLLLGAAACTKSYYSGPRPGFNGSGNVSNSEAADMVANSLAISSNGVVNIAADVTLNAASLANTHQGCGTTKADSVNRQSPSGASVTYNFIHPITILLNAIQGISPTAFIAARYTAAHIVLPVFHQPIQAAPYLQLAACCLPQLIL